MIMLKQSDLQDPNFLPKLAKAGNMSIQDFIKQFSSVALPPTASTSNLGLRPVNFHPADANGNQVDNISPGLSNYIHEYSARGNVDSARERGTGLRLGSNSPTQTPRPMTPEPRDGDKTDEKQPTVPQHHISH